MVAFNCCSVHICIIIAFTFLDDADSGISSSPSSMNKTINKTDILSQDQNLSYQNLVSEECEVQSDFTSKLPRLVSRHNVISRKDNLILSPEVESLNLKDMHDDTEEDHVDYELVDGKENEKLKAADKILARKNFSAATFQREFDLGDVLDYVKTGVACIIEDEVTQRFEAEELKSWNLLTRTNDKFRFINWKLTFFWGFGCFFRYCILLPGRIAILIVGVSSSVES